MVQRDELPDTFDELLNVRVELPEAPGETEKSCPVPMDEIRQHLAYECPGGEFAGGESVMEFQLKFARTAVIDDTRYWIWLFKDEREADSYVLVGAGSNQLLSYDETYGMTPEQIIVKEHFEID